MAPKSKIDRKGSPAPVVSVRFASDILEMLDLLTHNRSQFVRDATWEKIDRERQSE